MDPAFEQARQHFVDGIACFEAGRFEQAEARFLASLQHLPGRPSTLVNLAATRIRLGRPEQALEPLEQALSQRPDDPEAWSQRGVALSQLGRLAEAVPALERTTALTPHLAGPWLLLGQALQGLDQPQAALTAFDRALELDASLPEAWGGRGAILKDMGQVEEAIQAFERCQATGGDASLCSFFLASLRGQGAPSAPPAGYVASLFDHYADSFDTHLLGVLRYQAHEALVHRLAELHPGRFAAALDLGCGTGLCGALLAPRVDQLDGIDLAPLMLQKARERGLYRQLVQADLAAHLHATGQRYELVVAADVFPYVGALEAVFAGVRRVLRPDGWFCFSTELQEQGTGFSLGRRQSYAHSEPYLRQLAAEHGLDWRYSQRLAIREDQRRPIQGMAVFLSLPAAQP